MTTKLPERTTFTHPAWRKALQKAESSPCPDGAPGGTEILYRLSPQARRVSIEKCLPQSALLLLKGDHSGESLSVLSGMVWITQSGSLEDILLGAGESFDIPRKGTVLAESLKDARLLVSGSER